MIHKYESSTQQLTNNKKCNHKAGTHEDYKYTEWCMLGGTKNIILQFNNSCNMMICIIVFVTHKNQQKINIPQPAITCSKLTIETLEQGVKYVQS